MELLMNKQALANALQLVSKAVAVRTPKQVLMGILLEVHPDELVATAYNLELAIQTRVPADEETGLQVRQTGAIVLPARYFGEIVRKLPDTQIHMRVDANYMTEISAESVEFHLHGIDAEEFPELPNFIGYESMHIPAHTLGRLIESTVFAAATSEVRPALTGVSITSDATQLTFVATDGLRLAQHRVAHPDLPERHVVIPAKSLSELSKILPEDDSPVEMVLTPSHGLFVLGSTRFYTRLLEGSYPDTSRLIPRSARTQVVLPGDAFLQAIDRAALIARDKDNHMVRLEVEGDTLTVTSHSPEVGNVSETLHALRKEGEDLQIAFNGRYVIEAVRALDAAEIAIRFNGANQAFVIERSGDPSMLQLISPILWRS
ncbi:DNA polymerase III subunit beta [Alicyclobacillus vulcanalis]|uniref:Beta sliding clamp n=2 Tax=Alicyclobacillus TaxID=29330 RepID=A0A1N7LPI4_9BACL|nr:DNA polymerase III subunit beta [Alicyclobacillus vulcanalis]SIS75679.1 DNA polymerase III, beta subunit [Alicyclobacillus vulcanalis]